MQLNLGNLFAKQALRETGQEQDSLYQMSVTALRRALEAQTRGAERRQWAKTQLNLGATLTEWAGHRGAEEADMLLQEAVEAYREVLEVFTREAFPRDWAIVQNNLGSTVLERAARASRHSGSEADSLYEVSVGFFRKVLEVRTREAEPQRWAGTQRSLGVALQELGSRQSSRETADSLLEASVAPFQQALEVFTYETLPQDWAKTQNSLGIAFGEWAVQRRGEEAASLLEHSVEAFRGTLMAWTRDEVPDQWAIMHNNVATTTLKLATERGGATADSLLQEAEASLHSALGVVTRTWWAYAWAVFQRNLGTVYTAQGAYRNAEVRYDSVLAEWTDHQEIRIASRAVRLAARLVEGHTDSLVADLDTLIAQVAGQEEGFSMGDTFIPPRSSLISGNAALAPHQAWLTLFFQALEADDRDAIVAGLQAAKTSLGERYGQ